MSTPLISIGEARELVLRERHATTRSRAHRRSTTRSIACWPRTSRRRGRAAVRVLGDGRLRRAGRAGRPHAEGDRRVPRRGAVRPATSATARRSGSRPEPAVPAGATAVIRQEDVSRAPTATDRDSSRACVDGANIRRRRRGHARRDDRPASRNDAARGRARGRGRRRRRASRGHRPAASRRSCARATSCAPRRDALGPGEIHNSNAPMMSALATHTGAETVSRATAPRRPRRHRGGARTCARALRHRHRHRRRLGRARTTTSSRRSPPSASPSSSGESRCSRASRHGSGRAAGRSCSGCRATRSRRSSRSRCSPIPAIAAMLGSLRRAAARQPMRSLGHRRSPAIPFASRQFACDSSAAAVHRGDPQRAPGLPHPQLVDRGRRARPDPPGEGQLAAGERVQLHPLPR